MVHLIGPGGAGKTTVGPLLATQVGQRFRDLDAHLTTSHGDIDALIAAVGYQAYARANVGAYLALADAEPNTVVALSSGFMTYAPEVHPGYAAVRDAVVRSPTTFVLLPSLELEECVAETVRRQVSRGAGRTTAARAETVIRDRFARYLALPAVKVTTMRPPAQVAREIAARLAGSRPVPSGEG